MKRCPRCNRPMPRDFCQFCGYREGKEGDWQVPDLELGDKQGRYAGMFEQAQRTHRCAVCGIPITPDMLKSGEAKLEHGRYYCKVHAERRQRALNAVFSDAYSQRRWVSSFNTRTVGTVLAVVVAVISGITLRTSRSNLFSFLASSRAPIQQPVVSLQKIRLDGIREIGAGLYKAIVRGIVKVEETSVRRVVIVARLAFDGEELTGKTVVSEGVRVGRSVPWEVAIFLTREQAEELRKCEPNVSADVNFIE
mgnify:CR=1 FL=1